MPAQSVHRTNTRKMAILAPAHSIIKTERVDASRQTIPLPPVLGGLAVAGSIVLVVVGTRRS
jgi:hypothetical protein